MQCVDDDGTVEGGSRAKRGEEGSRGMRYNEKDDKERQGMTRGYQDWRLLGGASRVS